MASASEYLTKRLNIQKEIVTFRCLSRALSIHVNAAKNELAAFHASTMATDEPVHATYLLTGHVAPLNAYGLYRDENEMGSENEQLERVPTTKILLVGENELESSKAQFTRLSSVHIYSLSPSAIKDATLLAPAADYVRSQYVTKGKEFYQTVGVVVGPDVKVRAYALKKGKASLETSSKPSPPPFDEKPTDKHKPSMAPEKAKETKKGTLDWSKAKSKPQKDKEARVAQEAAKAVKWEKTDANKNSDETEQEKAVSKEESKTVLNKRQGTKTAVKKGSENSDLEVKKGQAEKPQRGKKRSSAIMSLSDSEDDEQDSNPTPKTKPRTSASPLPTETASTSDNTVRVKNGVLISDGEDDTLDAKLKLSRQKSKGKGRAIPSEDEDGPDRSVRAIMNLDDSHFIRHNKTSVEDEAKEEVEEDDVDMDSDYLSRPRPKRKRKPKKVVPIGSNGLPKKRVVKSRKSKDARGYMVTQDYSSYESASESEQAPVTSAKESKSTKGKEKFSKKEQVSGIPPATKARPNPRPSIKFAAEGEEPSGGHSKPVHTTGESKSDVKRSGAVSSGGIKSASNISLTSKDSRKDLKSYFGQK